MAWRLRDRRPLHVHFPPPLTKEQKSTQGRRDDLTVKKNLTLGRTGEFWKCHFYVSLEKV